MDNFVLLVIRRPKARPSAFLMQTKQRVRKQTLRWSRYATPCRAGRRKLTFNTKLYADHPVFLIPSTQYSRQSQADGAQFTGLSVDPASKDGKIGTGRVARWSFRPGSALPSTTKGSLAPWTPDKLVIRHDDEIGLFCHSYYAGGSYTTITNPPYFAPWIVKKATEDFLRVWKLDPAFLDDNGAQKTVQNAPDWAFLFPGRATIQDLMARSDLGRTDAQEDAQIEVYRKLFGLDSTLAGWNANYDALMGDKVLAARTNQFWQYDEAWYTTQKKRLGTEYMPKEASDGMIKWAEANGFMEETPVRRAKLEPLRLRVKFV